MDVAGDRKRATESALKEERGARAKAEDVSRRLAFVVGASQLLATHLDPEGALDSLVRLAVPTLAELCVIDLHAGGGQLRRAAVAHADPTIDAQIGEFLLQHPPVPEGDRPVADVLRTGQPEIGDDLSARWPDVASDLESLRLPDDFRLRSYLVVPLVARGSTLGTVLLASTTDGRRLGPDDLALAEDIARSAALALDTARLVADKEDLLALERGARADAELAELRLGVLAETWHKTHKETPEMMGQLFHLFDAPNRFGLPAFYTLHVWAWKENPQGAFVNWHSNVSCEHFAGEQGAAQ